MVKLEYIFITEGEFLYDPITKRVYRLKPPHVFMGFITEEGSYAPRLRGKEKIYPVDKQ